jgi:hypothetical protein
LFLQNIQMEKQYIINPTTNRKILLNGSVHKRLINTIGHPFCKLENPISKCMNLDVVRYLIQFCSMDMFTTLLAVSKTIYQYIINNQDLMLKYLRYVHVCKINRFKCKRRSIIGNIGNLVSLPHFCDIDKRKIVEILNLDSMIDKSKNFKYIKYLAYYIYKYYPFLLVYRKYFVFLKILREDYKDTINLSKLFIRLFFYIDPNDNIRNITNNLYVNTKIVYIHLYLLYTDKHDQNISFNIKFNNEEYRFDVDSYNFIYYYDKNIHNNTILYQYIKGNSLVDLPIISLLTKYHNPEQYCFFVV